MLKKLMAKTDFKMTILSISSILLGEKKKSLQLIRNKLLLIILIRQTNPFLSYFSQDLTSWMSQARSKNNNNKKITREIIS